MKNMILGVRLLPSLFIAAAILQACNSGTSVKKEDSKDSAKLINQAVAPVDETSSKFAVNAANGGMLEVELGKLAQEKSKNQRVRNFAGMMIQNHSQVGDELKGIAKNRNIALPATLGDNERSEMEKLQRKSVKEFDIAYMEMMVDDHKTDIDLFKKAADDLPDQELKAFASSKLSVLKLHQDSADAVKASLKK